MGAKNYENPTMLSRVTAKNVGDVFLRHTVHYLNYIYNKYLPNVQLFLNFSSTLSVRLANITLDKLMSE